MAFCDQSQSTLFFKLPPEVRALIYREVFPAKAVHISCRNRSPLEVDRKQNNTLVSIPCLTDYDFSHYEVDKYDEPDIDWGLGHQKCLREFKRRYQKGKLADRVASLRRSRRGSFVPLMLTCRRM
jgi:hypothetical protein